MLSRSEKLSGTPCLMQNFLSGDGMILRKVQTSRYPHLKLTKSWPTDVSLVSLIVHLHEAARMETDR
jgi:hypothetical protein